jgi:uncharacterized protein (UPF0332 family)
MTRYEEEISSNLERADTNLQVARELLEKEYYDGLLPGRIMLLFTPLALFY